MKKQLILGGMVLVLTQSLWAEGFMEDIDSLSQDLEKAKLCQTLQKLGGQSPRCKNVVPMLEGGGSQGLQGAQAMPGAPLSNIGVGGVAQRNRLAAMEDEPPQVISYQRKGSRAEIEVTHLDSVSSLQVGQKVGKWTLVGLNDKSATFAAGKLRKSVYFRSSANVS